MLRLGYSATGQFSTFPSARAANRPASVSMKHGTILANRPPKGYGTHHYHFRLHAISRPTLDMKPTLTASDVLKTAELYTISAPSRSAPITAE